jgi:hypothetical protein
VHEDLLDESDIEGLDIWNALWVVKGNSAKDRRRNAHRDKEERMCVEWSCGSHLRGMNSGKNYRPDTTEVIQT